MAFSAAAKEGYAFAISAKNETDKAFSAIKSDLKGIDVTIGGVISKAKSLAGPAAIGFTTMATAGTAALTAIVASTSAAANEIDNLSRIAGTNSTTLQEMAYGAKFLGVEQDKLSDILKDTNDKVGDFLQTGAGPMADFFDQIAPKVGVTADQFRGLSGADALQLYVSSLEKANLSQQEMTFYMEAIASDSTALLPLLQKNGEAMRAQAEEAQQLGIVLDDVDIAILQETDRQMKRSREALTGFTNQLAVEFAPIINAVSNELLNAAKEAGGFGNVATMVFDYVITAAGKTADVIRGLEAVWHGVKWVAADAIDTMLYYLEELERDVRGFINLMPGVEISAESAVGNIRQSVSNVKAEIAQDLQDAVNTPLPSEQIRIWAETVKSQAQEVAANVAAAQQGRAANDEGEGEGGEDPEVLAARQKYEQLKLLKEEYYITEAEEEELRFLEQMEKLRARFEEAELPMLMEFRTLKEQLEEEHQKRLSKIEEKGLSEREKFQRKSFKDQSKQVFGDLANITAGVAQHNKGLFELNKAAGIANAVINTYTGVTQSLAAYPMPLAAVMAAAHLAAGLAQVSSIRSQSFSGGKGSGGGGGGTVAVGTTPITNAPSNIAQSPAANDAAKEKPKNNVYINIEPDDRFSGRQVRELMERIAEQSDDLNVNF